MTRTFIYLVLADFQSAYKSEQFVWKALQEDFNFFAIHKTQELKNTMLNYANVTQLSNKTIEMKKIIQEYEQALTKYPALSPILADYIIIYKLTYLIKTNDLETLASTISSYCAYYERTFNKSHIDLYRNFLLVLGVSYYKLKKYNEALVYMASIKNQYSSQAPRIDMVEFSKLIYLLIYFEKTISFRHKANDWMAFIIELKVYYDSIRRRNKDEDYTLELLICKQLLRLKENTSTVQLCKILNHLDSEINNLYTLRIPYILHLFSNFDILDWCKCCIQLVEKD